MQHGQHSQQLIVGNWKMNGRFNDVFHLQSALEKDHRVYRGVICPPFTLLEAMREALPKDVALGAQDCSATTEGAHTGDVAAAQLQDMGVRFVIVGHSERRRDHNESSEVIKQKTQHVLEADMVPIVCVGEPEEIYKKGETLDFLKSQIQAFLPLLRNTQGKNNLFYIAYEPLWAIGTGRQPSLDEIAHIHKALFNMAGLNALYGGSVKLENYKKILEREHVGGVLVGGESLKPERFAAMLRGEQE